MIFERPQDCQDCELCKTRTQVVQSVLPEGVEVVFVGEGPGFEEDKQGIPFVGASGKLFNSILEEVGINREDVGISNVVACFPSSKNLILTINGYRQIRKIKKGDLVLTHIGKYRKVTDIIRRHSDPKQPFVEISVKYLSFMKNEKVKKLKITQDHPFLTQRGWVLAKDLTCNDSIKALGERCEVCGNLFFQTNIEKRKCCSITCANKTILTPARKKKISKNMKLQYITGKRDRFKITKHANEECKKLLRESTSYPFRKAKSWNKGKTKWDDFRIERAAKKGVVTRKRTGSYYTQGKIGTAALRKYREDYPLVWKTGLKRMKHKLTRLERIFAWALKKEKISFTPQFPVGLYRTDFRINDTNILVECDGFFHFSEKAKSRDKKRDEIISGLGYQILRFKDTDINTNVFSCIDVVKRLLKNHRGEYEFVELKVTNVRSYFVKKVMNLYNIEVEKDIPLF